AALDPVRAESAREERDLVPELRAGVGALRACDRRVVDQGGLVGAAAFDVPVERVVRGVQPAAREPAVERRARVIEDPRGPLVPVDRLRSLAPELLRLLERAPVD